ncbi:TIGR04086 family membrane protein [Jeotgalibacillus salarius]|uniref:TIGR04086 family membrane protein n=1 Tax=Jeotgalibacillus salarius TaxID=546023 RepID=A0A4Y8LKB9_9BACL|nr:TIGR04086 family membrane protein [Jeotgalibacillus salarius]TFE01048.1 TIGR04086 family membrane protein [Jeotgalibacillus salarius]
MVTWKKTAAGLGLSFGLVVIMISLYAAVAASILHFTDITEFSLQKWHGMAGAAAVCIGSIIGSAASGQKGIYIGLLTALGVIGGALLLKESTFEWSHLIHYGLLLACGMAGGIAGVNVFGRSKDS